MKLHILAICAVGLAACSATTPYQRLTATSLRGGYTDKDLGRDVIRVEFSANGFTSRETAQSFWLWRCAEITLEKNFDGFEILSDIRLASTRGHSRSNVGSGHAEKVAYVPIIIPMQDDSNKPDIVGDIHLLKAPIAAQPPKVFDARKLKDALAPYVLPIMKSPGNVKPHIHEYLLPPGKLGSGSPEI